MGTEQKERERVEEHLAAVAVVAAQVVVTTLVGLGRHGSEIARALWPTGGVPRAHTWDALVERATDRARDRSLHDVLARLDRLGPSVLDVVIREEDAGCAATIQELLEISGRILFDWAERIQDAADHETRWMFARATRVLQHDALHHARELIAVLEEPEALLAPLERMIGTVEGLRVACANPELMPLPDRAETEALLRRGAAGRRRLSAELGSDPDEVEGADEPERAPEETLARLERVASELARIATPLGLHVDRVLFGGAPSSPTTFVQLVEAIDARLEVEHDGVVLVATEALDQALLAVGPPEPGTESLLSRSAERLLMASEKVHDASSSERAIEIARAAESMLRLVAANTVGVAAGTGEEQLVARLTRLLGLTPGADRGA